MRTNQKTGNEANLIHVSCVTRSTIATALTPASINPTLWLQGKKTTRMDTPVPKPESSSPLTDEEQQELKLHPIPSEPTTQAQFAMRQRIAQKLCAEFLAADPTLTSAYRDIYDAYPMWKFCRDRTSGLQRRIYGVLLYGDKNDGKQRAGLHVATCMLGWINLVVGGMDATECEVLDAWTAEDVEVIKSKCAMNPNSQQAAASFLDPLGFLVFVEQESQ
jgi:hypothetical protein